LRSATLTIQREVRPIMEALLESCGHESLDVALVFFGGLVRLRAIADTVHSSRFGQRASLTRLDPRLAVDLAVVAPSCALSP
jgi:hypothetical protein